MSLWRPFVESVNSRHPTAVLVIAHRLFTEQTRYKFTNVSLNRAGLIMDIVPWHISRATAYRLLEDFKRAGYIGSVGERADVIEPTALFCENYRSLMSDLISQSSAAETAI